MVLLPNCLCCDSCDSCESVLSANRLYVQIQSFQFFKWTTIEWADTRQNFFQYQAGHRRTLAKLFPFGEYSGVFELTKISSRPSSATWRYNYPAGELLAGDEYLEVQIYRPNFTTASLDMDIRAMFRFIEYADFSQEFTPQRSLFVGGQLLPATSPALTFCYNGELVQPLYRRSRTLSNFFARCPCTTAHPWGDPVLCENTFTAFTDDSYLVAITSTDEKCGPSQQSQTFTSGTEQITASVWVE